MLVSAGNVNQAWPCCNVVPVSDRMKPSSPLRRYRFSSSCFGEAADVTSTRTKD
jgi:hypothetical protein